MKKEGIVVYSSLKQGLQNSPETNSQMNIPVFGYELLRDILMPGILGKDTPEISYWAGKHLARKFPLLSSNEITSFFQESSWGELHLIEETKNEMKFELKGNIVERRIQMNSDPCFTLEAGFIAEQIQNQKQFITEAFAELNKKKNHVIFTARWDRKDPIK
ncbi:YslB family protein [Bacillus sp. FJAT-49732]|uniref:YslB family protein n=1 Tax=Lederbergia citrisecunda TaxID=2833583 RepID=A0A942TNE0_9BACI|nr:YslB family protein [Lederbergia citrisecunda]MBS4199902.1 YslB family protein [Lederbergia citrisecunda]